MNVSAYFRQNMQKESMMNSENIFEQWIHPLSLAHFKQNYLHQKCLHHSPKKNRKVMNWTALNRLLDQGAFWTSDNLKLYLNKEPVPVDQYCALSVEGQGHRIYRPHPHAVHHWLSQGGSLVLNDIHTLIPEIKQLASNLRHLFQGRIQANLYVSMGAIPAFASHFDVHDVFVFQTEGQKEWYLYENRIDAPIAHPHFHLWAQDQHEQAKGNLQAKIMMKAGDFLYIPRGCYHDALAISGPSMHLTLGLTRPVGLDVISLLFENAVDQSLFRQYLDPETSFETCKVLAQEIKKLMEGKDFQTKVSHLFQTEENIPSYKFPEIRK